MKKQNEVQKRLSAARTALVLDHPFFGALALKLDPVECGDETTETMATDGRKLFYNPIFVTTMSDVELVGLYAHEVLHPAMQHHTRREGRDHDLWNEAADYAINPLILDAGLSLPEGALLDAAYQGLSAEQIYQRLLTKQKQDGGQGQPGGQGQSKKKQPGEVLDAPEPASDAAEWQVAVKQAAQAAKMMGSLPGSFASVIERETAPKVDWKAELRKFVQLTAAADYSWKMPNRRYIAGGLYMPEIKSESMPPLVLVLDTSASTSDVRATFTAEVSAIADECQPERVYIIHCDARVHHVEIFERGEPVLITEFHGNGGTSFIPPFEYLDAEQIEPAALIYLTDLEGRFPDAPSYPVLWASTTDAVAPFGDTLLIEGGA